MSAECLSNFRETNNFLNVLMCEYAITDITKPVVAQGIISCSEIYFIGTSKHAVLHYPARLLVNCVTKSCYPDNKEWYRNLPIPKSFEIDANFVKVLQTIKDSVNPKTIRFFTPIEKIDRDASCADAELIEQTLTSVFDIKCTKSATLEDCNPAHNQYK